MNPDGEPESTVDVGRVARHHMHQVGAVGYREFPRRGTGRFLQVVDGVVALVRGGPGYRYGGLSTLRTGMTPSQRFSPRSPARNDRNADTAPAHAGKTRSCPPATPPSLLAR